MVKQYHSNSTSQTEYIAEKFAATLQGDEIIAYIGGMGAGKTAFTRGLCRGLGYIGEVNSPTYAIVHVYYNQPFDIYHYDMYRIKDNEDLETTGFYEAQGNGLIIVEWSENITIEADQKVIYIEIEVVDENTREITIKNI